MPPTACPPNRGEEETVRFEELSYASEDEPWLKRQVIRSIERCSNRRHLEDLYEIWQATIVGRSDKIMTDLLDLLDVKLDLTARQWPLQPLPDTPLVMIANHPFGIGDGIAVLSLAETLGRPCKVLVSKELLRVPEFRPYALPIDFYETRAALETNLKTKRDALRFLKEGYTVIVFPAGGVATAKKPFGKAEDLPWKQFPARLIQQGRASVLPVYFHGQNSWVFHLASHVSATLRTSLLIREFGRFPGSTIPVHVGNLVPYEEFGAIRNRKILTQYLHERVFEMAPAEQRPPTLGRPPGVSPLLEPLTRSNVLASGRTLQAPRLRPTRHGQGRGEQEQRQTGMYL
ncbi:MAG: lysophospholipid acyltransferase family protein [Pseudomonadota bacterium]